LSATNDELLKALATFRRTKKPAFNLLYREEAVLAVLAHLTMEFDIIYVSDGPEDVEHMS